MSPDLCGVKRESEHERKKNWVDGTAVSWSKKEHTILVKKYIQRTLPERLV